MVLLRVCAVDVKAVVLLMFDRKIIKKSLICAGNSDFFALVVACFGEFSECETCDVALISFES